MAAAAKDIKEMLHETVARTITEDVRAQLDLFHRQICTQEGQIDEALAVAYKAKKAVEKLEDA